jgi:hypothetical protein
MPYVRDRDTFTLPSSQETPIWRYMDLAKFVSFLKDRSLYLSRSDLLGDPFEGSMPEVNIRDQEEWFREIGIERPADWGRFRNIVRYWTYVNCWHYSPHESAAMWSIYGSRGMGVVVTSTITRLQDALESGCAELEDRIFLGQVHYIDYAKEKIPEEDGYWPFICKRKSFEHEKEIRVLTMRPPKGEGLIDPRDTDLGIAISVDITELVTSVRVAPDSPPWFRDVVQELVGRFQLSVDVSQSSLIGVPLF